MKKSFAARRVARKLGQGDEDDDSTDTGANVSGVKRPLVKSKKPTSYVKQTIPVEEDEGDGYAGVITPKRSQLSKIAIQRNAAKRAPFRANELPSRMGGDTDDDGPSYDVDALQALKESTPSTPQQFASESEDSSDRALDLANKFGSSLTKYQDSQASAIPSAATIAEAKSRRARLALEEKADEYISLDPDNPGWEEDEDGNMTRDGDGRLVLKEKDKYNIKESRLVRDDEDVMEGFDEFTGEAGRTIAMGASTKPTDRQAKRDEISAQIANAEGDSDSEEMDAEEIARNAAFEAAQTRHGTYADNATATLDPYAHLRPKTPPTISPLPSLDSVTKRLRATLLDMESRKRDKEAEMSRLTQEKFRLRGEEERVQNQLKEVAEKFREMKLEKGIIQSSVQAIVPSRSSAAIDGRENTTDNHDGGDHEYDDDERQGLGLGIGNAFGNSPSTSVENALHAANGRNAE